MIPMALKPVYNMENSKSLEKRCNFKTERLLIRSWKYQNKDLASEDYFTNKVEGILTHQVTKSLPDGWQGIKTKSDAKQWIKDRADESHFLTVQLLSTNEIIGFVFLYESDSQDNSCDLRFGYLLSETYWAKGYGSELVQGLVEWCDKVGDINSISGGVETDNIASIKVLEKNGFSPSTLDDASGNVIFYERKFNV